MRSRALIAFALLGGAVAGTLAGCATAEMKSACSPVFSWAAPAFHCGGTSGASQQIAVKPPAPEPEPTTGPPTGPTTGPTTGPPSTPPPPPEPTPPPEPSPTAKIAGGKIELSDTVEFEADSAVLAERSRRQLDDV